MVMSICCVVPSAVATLKMSCSVSPEFSASTAGLVSSSV
jgi:hypothetical protein